jgi:hypothetical protein
MEVEANKSAPDHVDASGSTPASVIGQSRGNRGIPGQWPGMRPVVEGMDGGSNNGEALPTDMDWDAGEGQVGSGYISMMLSHGCQ